MNNIIIRIKTLSYDFEKNHGPYADILLKVLVSAEDRRAHWHLGIDLISIGRALINAFQTGKVRGVSTIEQQIIRTLLPRRHSAFRSKPKELLLSFWIAIIFPKRKIWGAYLNCAYFGAHWDCLQDAIDDIAANPKHITLNEACALIAHLKYPAPENHWPKGMAAHARRTQFLIDRCQRIIR